MADQGSGPGRPGGAIDAKGVAVEALQAVAFMPVLLLFSGGAPVQTRRKGLPGGVRLKEMNLTQNTLMILRINRIC